jgi:N6-adenosine-specific RNA methylase IME4
MCLYTKKSMQGRKVEVSDGHTVEISRDHVTSVTRGSVWMGLKVHVLTSNNLVDNDH